MLGELLSNMKNLTCCHVWAFITCACLHISRSSFLVSVFASHELEHASPPLTEQNTQQGEKNTPKWNIFQEKKKSRIRRNT